MKVEYFIKERKTNLLCEKGEVFLPNYTLAKDVCNLIEYRKNEWAIRNLKKSEDFYVFNFISRLC